jgi:protoheme IX farnesyltransferase
MTTVAQRTALRQAVSDYLALTKPRITLLVLVTTAAAFWVASKESFSIALFAITLVGTGLASAAAGVLNCLIDRDVDALMARTQGRPLPAGRVHPLSALLFGAVLSVGSFVVLAWGTNLLAASLALVAILFYTFIYTRWLKRTSPFCTEVGGIAGALPPVIGWAAATGEIGAPALVLFGILFFWQPRTFGRWRLGELRSTVRQTSRFSPWCVERMPRAAAACSTRWRSCPQASCFRIRWASLESSTRREQRC